MRACGGKGARKWVCGREMAGTAIGTYWNLWQIETVPPERQLVAVDAAQTAAARKKSLSFRAASPASEGNLLPCGGTPPRRA